MRRDIVRRINQPTVDWQTRIPGSVPVLCRRMHRVYWVPRRYVRMIAAAMAMGTFTVREIAERTGYSVHGAWAALQSMTEMAIGRVSAVRGCRGRTRFVVSSDATANVPSTVTEKPSKDNEHRVVEGTFHDRPLIEPVRDGLAAWKALRATLVVG